LEGAVDNLALAAQDSNQLGRRQSDRTGMAWRHAKWRARPRKRGVESRRNSVWIALRFKVKVSSSVTLLALFARERGFCLWT
jgi:hypothetical protein